MRTTPTLAFDEHTQRNDRRHGRRRSPPSFATRRAKRKIAIARTGCFPAARPPAGAIFCSPPDQAQAQPYCSLAPPPHSRLRPAPNISTCRPTRPRSRAAPSPLTAATAHVRNSKPKCGCDFRRQTKIHPGASLRSTRCWATHALGPAFRTPSWRYPDHRSVQTHALCARHGRRAAQVHDGGPQAISFGDAQAFHRMLRERADRMEQAHAENRAGYARSAQHIGMDRRSVRNNRPRSRPQGRRQPGCSPKVPTPRS